MKLEYDELINIFYLLGERETWLIVNGRETVVCMYFHEKKASTYPPLFSFRD